MLENIKRLIKIYKVKLRFSNVKILSGVNVGKNTIFEGMNCIGKNSYFIGYMGYGTYIGSNCLLNGKIGRFCCIADDVKVYIGKHPIEYGCMNPMFYSTKKQNGNSYVVEDLYEENELANQKEKYGIIVGNDVWIGARVTILGGVNIGDGAVIAAGAVVTKNVKPYSIVGGVPARIIRMRFDENIVCKLLKYQWWNRDRKWIEENASSFRNIENLLQILEK